MKKICFIYILVICFIVNGKAQNVQPNWVFQTPQSGNSSYIARDYILLKPGFSYKANKEESFHAYTNPCLLFPPSDNTYARPDGTIVGDASAGICCWQNTGRVECESQWSSNVYNSYFLSAGN